MKRNWKISFRLLIVLSLLLFAGCNKKDHATHDTYTCPMHPTVVSDRAGTCPVCGMDLVRKARPGEEVVITPELASASKAPSQSVISSVSLISPEYRSVSLSENVVGVVTYDTRKIYTVSARTGGRVETISFKYAFQQMKKGQKIAEIYSPQLAAAQRELLYIAEHDPQNYTLIEEGKRKLMLLGLSDLQIENLLEQKTVGNTFSVYSPYDGYVITDNAPPSASIPMVNSESGAGSTRSTLAIREGSYITAGQTLVKIVNTNAVRIELNLLRDQIEMIELGDKIAIDMGNGTTETASVDFVQPFFNEGESFLKVWLYTDKIETLPIGQLVRANIQLKSKQSLWIPTAAVIDLGTEKVVFVQDRGVLKPKKIRSGITTEDFVEVTSGLATSDQIAANAQYLVDSESFIKPVN
ncbi:MAG TPA: efflux RND transporter periplasmic adaptor subunit [Chryseolinea sp.]